MKSYFNEQSLKNFSSLKLADKAVKKAEIPAKGMMRTQRELPIPKIVKDLGNITVLGMTATLCVLGIRSSSLKPRPNASDINKIGLISCSAATAGQFAYNALLIHRKKKLCKKARHYFTLISEKLYKKDNLSERETANLSVQRLQLIPILKCLEKDLGIPGSYKEGLL